MKNFVAKLGFAVGLAAVVAISAMVGALAKAPLAIANGTYGVESGSIRSVQLVCLDKNKDINNGVTIKTSNVTIVWDGHRGTGVTAICP
jgi:hypothetical protein